VETELLKEVCNNEADFNLIGELLEIQKSKIILVNNYGIQSDLENHLEKHFRKRQAC